MINTIKRASSESKGEAGKEGSEGARARRAGEVAVKDNRREGKLTGIERSEREAGLGEHRGSCLRRNSVRLWPLIILSIQRSSQRADSSDCSLAPCWRALALKLNPLYSVINYNAL